MAYTRLTLPDRPLTLRPGLIAAPRLAGFLILVFLAVGGAIAWWQAPGLWRDWQISRNPVTVADSEVRDGKCTTRKAFFTDCEAHLVWSHGGQSYETEVSLMFVDIHSGDYYVDVVISGDKPHLATLSLGVEKLWNRIAMFAAFTALFFGGALAVLWQWIRAARGSRQLAAPGRLMLIPTEITQSQTARGVTQITYRDPSKPKRRLASNFARGEDPLMVWDDQGNARALAVRHETAALPALLDRGLMRVDLSDAERRAALDLLAAEETERFGAPQTETAPPKKKLHVLRGILTFFGIVLFFVLAALGWWLWYVLGASSQYDRVGMEINNLMPAPVNDWACGKLEERFGHLNAPWGCTAADHVSWK
ncbi:hypothetical protein [Pseudogemmobacter humi]|uniref:Uncharacterized protein n=1 Tax=Pseudogemmobacter humi TaxID=2483812 RepID=A0A3P5XA54_9RHOB|nr:hypothetical protein [Pseudogemmobacter humi]VDC24334.1 hypothetical protein XINFAN_01185 [Pseudogemmobacter humi]